MLQEFNKVTTTSNFIKNLLISTYLPLIRTVRDFDYIIVDRLYIYKCNVIKCTKSGYIVTGYNYVNFEGKRAEYKVKSEYYFGEKNDKLCTNYISNSEGYDSLTHERLGKYLRSLRDMYDLNLMPLYNCFSNQIFQSHHITNERIEKTNLEYDTKIYKVPIRFNTDYTICMENLGVTTFAPAFIKHNNLVKLNNTRFGNGVDATNKYSKLHRTGVIQNKANLRFNEPILIRFNNIPETKSVTYFESSLREIDSLHNNEYYSPLTVNTLPRSKYYLKNYGKYDYVGISSEEFNANKTKYYYNNDGIITQCTDLDFYSIEKSYFVLDASATSSVCTYLVTSKVPTSDNLDNFYYGVEPATGRIDSTYTSERVYISYEDGVLIQNMEPEDDITIEYDATNKIFKVIAEQSIIYDSPGFNVVCMWTKCDKYHKYSEDETYYIRENGVFYEWEYSLDEATFNENKTFYYIKSGDDYIQCDSTSVFDPTETYYVYYLEDYITAEEYYFIMHTTDFYTGNGFKDEPSNFYKLVDGQFIQCTQSDTFDINTVYAEKVIKENYTWKVYDPVSGTLVDSTDTYIKDNVKYYSQYTLETKKNYVYDITEENCALYDYLEDCLYLLIQVPKSFDTNIIILEGDYTSTASRKIIDDSQVDLLPRPMVDYLYTSNLKLMAVATKKVIPFSDSLLEFLLWNAINNLDSINNNMDRLLLAIGKILSDPFSIHYANYWYPDYRKIVYDIGRNYNNIYVADNLGYVTKDIEQVINTTYNSDSYITDDPIDYDRL